MKKVRGASGGEEGFPSLSHYAREALEAVGLLEDALVRLEALPDDWQALALAQLERDCANWPSKPDIVREALRKWFKDVS